MQYGIPVAKDVYWVGVNDRRTALFEGIWPIPRGVSYNSYLIVDEKTVLIDTVKD
ncbi:MAG: FprA family A-type flavoprotein, partial [Solirubrobacterales bacterium]